jgi:hypothetical protein
MKAYILKKKCFSPRLTAPPCTVVRVWCGTIFIVSKTHVAVSIFEESNITNISFYSLCETIDTTLIYCEQ